MKSIVCTLFEGHYHFGLAILANSLVRNGFTGDIYAGYRGKLPPWVSQVETTNGNETTYEIEGTTSAIRFRKLATDVHLTNYKPDFMLKLLDETDCSGICYFDPDIVVKCPWQYVDSWIRHGIALCEDVNSPLPASHPRRLAWREYFRSYGRELEFQHNEYANGGFVGLTRKDKAFLEGWRDIQSEMADDLGGLDKSMFNLPQVDGFKAGPSYMFNKSDQDALNAAMAAYCDLQYCFSGRDAMDFTEGGYTFSHSLGREKPWVKNLLVSAMHGRPPSRTDKVFWDYATSPIPAYSASVANRRKLTVRFCSFIGRFYRAS